MGSEDVGEYNPTAFEKALSSKDNLAILCPGPTGLYIFFLQSCIARGFEQEHKTYTLMLTRTFLCEDYFPCSNVLKNILCLYQSTLICQVKFFLLITGRRKVSDIRGSTRKKGTYEVGTYFRFSCERLRQE